MSNGRIRSILALALIYATAYGVTLIGYGLGH